MILVKFGDITIRFGQEGDNFLGSGRREPVAVESNHVIYADDVKCTLLALELSGFL